MPDYKLIRHRFTGKYYIARDADSIPVSGTSNELTHRQRKAIATRGLDAVAAEMDDTNQIDNEYGALHGDYWQLAQESDL